MSGGLAQTDGVGEHGDVRQAPCILPFPLFWLSALLRRAWSGMSTKTETSFQPAGDTQETNWDGVSRFEKRFRAAAMDKGSDSSGMQRTEQQAGLTETETVYRFVSIARGSIDNLEKPASCPVAVNYQVTCSYPSGRGDGNLALQQHAQGLLI